MICLDSDAIIDYLNGKKDAIDAVEKYSDELVTTEINVFEVFYGIYAKKDYKDEESIASNFFNSVNVLGCNKGSGKLGAEILALLNRKGMTIEQNDCLIASIILKNGFNRILTKNKKHFDRIENMKVVEY
jgi:tRNA(fMet)-specific endonuclease VapC